MLSVIKFDRAHKIRFTGFPSVVEIKENFALRNHGVVAALCAAYRQSSPTVLASGNCPGKLPCVSSRSFVKTAREASGPVRRPRRYEAHRSVVIGAREIEDVVTLAEPQLVFWLPANRGQPRACLRAGWVQSKSLPKFAAGLASFARGAQCPRPRSVKVSAFWIELHGGVECPQSLFCFSFARIHARKTHPIVRIVPRDFQDCQVLLFRF